MSDTKRQLSVPNVYWKLPSRSGWALDAKEFVVFDNTPIEIEQGDIVYITGQSGGGKSTLLRKLAEQWNKAA